VAARPITQSFNVVANIASNGGVETGVLSPWLFLINADGQVSAAGVVDSTSAADGLEQDNFPLTEGKNIFSNTKSKSARDRVLHG
jgi:hypothetical protein